VTGFDLLGWERPRLVAAAEAALDLAPETIVAAPNPRSAGGRHDFSSEGDYWWPDLADPGGPYIRRDGFSNPDAFGDHRRLLLDFATRCGALMAAYQATGTARYAEAAARHLDAWFVAPATRMNPSLAYAQAIPGICDGRGIGLIDTVHLAEIALGLAVLEDAPAYAAIRVGVEGWFADYLAWFTTHPYGLAERDEHNNHAVCWALQAAAFARAVGDKAVLADCRRRFRDILLPGQMAADGAFPAELARSKPYGYSIFNLDVMTALAVAVSGDDGGDLEMVTLRLADGRGILRGIDFLAPFLADKARWPYGRDVEYWRDWPARQPALLFGALAAGRDDWLALWRTLPAEPAVFEIRRNFPVRNPSLWLARRLTRDDRA
jgi:hypothetical protein